MDVPTDTPLPNHAYLKDGHVIDDIPEEDLSQFLLIPNRVNARQSPFQLPAELPLFVPSVISPLWPQPAI